MSGKSGNEKVSEIDNHVTEKYNVIRRLGKGAYGIVWKAVDRRSKETVAVKKIFDAFRNQTDAQRTFREIMFLLSFANHDNIIQLIGLHKANNDQDIYLVFEYMETDLHNVIKRGNILKDIHKVFIMYQLFKATKYIHSGNVIHRDLKPSNILLNAQCHCKIADFGLARSVSQTTTPAGDGEAGESSSDPTLTDYVATRWYRAPEILIASRRYTKGIDLWSLGCILGEMLLEKPLFPGSSTINQVERIMATLPTPTAEDLASIGAGYGLNLLEKRPAAIPRRTLRDLLPPNISNSAFNLISGLIVFNPNHRLTAVEALEHSYVAEFHSRAHEPERGGSVVPPFRDDVQLSIDEYRNKLYTMMDEKHRKHKNMSKSRIRRLSEHMRKDETSGTTAFADLHPRSKAPGKAVPQPHRSHLPAPPMTKQQPQQQQQPPSENLVAGAARNRQCTEDSMMNGSYRNVPPGQAKSCLYLGQHHHQRQVSQSQRSIQSDQVGGATYDAGDGYRVSTTCQPKFRRGVKPQQHHRLPIPRAIGVNAGETTTLTNYQVLSRGGSRFALPKRLSLDEMPGIRAKYITRMPNSNNVTKHFAPTMHLDPKERDSTIVHRANKSQQSQAVQNYLNQTLPISSNFRTKTRFTVERSILEPGYFESSGTTAVGKQHQEQRRRQSSSSTSSPSHLLLLNVTENRSKSASMQQTRSQNLKNLVKRSNNDQISRCAAAMNTVGGSFNNHSQNHGVITASAYRDLRNGSMR